MIFVIDSLDNYKMTLAISIDRLLQSNSDSNTVFHTHVSLGKKKGKYALNKQTLEQLWGFYCEYINQSEKPAICLAEKPDRTSAQIVSDIDIKIPLDEDDDILMDSHIYTGVQLEKTIEIHQSVLKNIIDGPTDEMLLCVVLEKPIYYIHTGGVRYAKNGFHLHFPNAFLSKTNQEEHFFPRVKNLMKSSNVFENLTSDSGSLIDSGACGNSWLLYGSSKEEGKDPYRFSKVVTADGDEIDLEKAFKNYKIYDNHENVISIAGNVMYYLPRILSILPYNRKHLEVKPTLASISDNRRHDIKQGKKYTSISVDEAINEATRLLPLLADWRADSRDEWLKVGFALFNISEGSQDGLDLWIDFSSRCSEKFDEYTCISQWGSMITKDMTIRSLHFRAKIDDPAGYKEFLYKKALSKIDDNLEATHNGIAKILYDIAKTEFVCASISSNIWFQFNNHRWEEIEDGIFLRMWISDYIIPYYVSKRREYFDKKEDDVDKGTAAMYELRMKQINKTINNLKSAPFKSNIMKECRDLFYDKRFHDRLNKNPYIIAFKNGVYDLKENNFRAGEPDDYLSRTLPINYTNFERGGSEVGAVNDFLEKVFPDTSIRKYFLDTSSDIFVGGNQQKTVLFWTGEGGDNAKSVTQTIFESMFGDLAIKFNTTLITGKKGNIGAAAPELSRAGNGVRWAVLEEPDGDEALNIGIMKALSGGDSYWARDLFEKGKNVKETKPLFKLTFICNKLPRIRNSDKATWNRIRVIPFESTFVRQGENVPDDYSEQLLQKRFPMDLQFNQKIPALLEPFAWLLLEHRKAIQGKPRIEPAKVKSATEHYRRQNDIYRQFIDENLVPATTNVSLTEIYSHFKEWFRESFPNTTLPVKNDVKEYFCTAWGEPGRGSRWPKWRFRTLEDDLESGDAIILTEDDLIQEGKSPL